MPSMDEVYDVPPPPSTAEVVPRQESTALLDPRQQANVEMYTKEIQSITRATLAPLATQNEAGSLAELLARGRNAMKGLEVIRRAVTDPLNKRVKNVNAIFRPLTEALDGFDAIGKRTLLAFDQAERARIRREQEEAQRRQAEAATREAEAEAKAAAAPTEEERKTALLEAEAASKDQMTAIVTAPMEAPRAHRTETGTAGIRERWVFEIVDQALLPRSFLTADEKAIRSAVACGVRTIPGVSIHLEEGITVRMRT